MTRDRRLAGAGGIAFAISLAVGFTLFGPKGGSYSAAEIDSFLAQTSSSLVISIGLFIISVVGLVVMMAYAAPWSPPNSAWRFTEVRRCPWCRRP
jgi:hypothetical protein